MHKIISIAGPLLLGTIISLASCVDGSPPALSSRKESPRAEAEIEEPWHLFGKNGINIRPAWEMTTGSKNVTIAVLDGQFLPDNPAFSQGRCLAKTEYFNFLIGEKKPGYHGAAVASLINTCEDNPLALIGVNKNSRILWLERPIKTTELMFLSQWALGNKTVCNSSKYIRCSESNKYPAHVLNLSYAVDLDANDYINRRGQLIVAKEANDQGSILVAAAGNEAQNTDSIWPASVTGVIAVGATTKSGTAWQHSNWGETVEIMAPGADIPVASSNEKILVSGTSMAAPIISGVISLMRSVYSELNWKTAIYFLQSTAVKMDCHSYCIAERTADAQTRCRKDCCVGEQQVCTPGRVDAGAAIALAKDAAIHGLPAVALADTDKYLIQVQNKKGTFKLFNVGGARGKYKVSSPDGTVLFSSNQRELEVEISAKGQPGDQIDIAISTTDDFHAEARIRIASPASGTVTTFSDEIVIYAGEF